MKSYIVTIEHKIEVRASGPEQASRLVEAHFRPTRVQGCGPEAEARFSVRSLSYSDREFVEIIAVEEK